MNEIKKCKNCLLPETYPGLHLSTEDVCNFCTDYEKHPLKGVDELRRLLSSKKGKQYDCLVPLSGGRDSTYVLYMVKKVLNQRTLVYNYDTELVSDAGLKNIQNSCNILGVKLVRLRSKRDVMTRILYNHFRFSAPLGPLYVIRSLCAPCFFGCLWTMVKIAEEKNIPTIITGYNIIDRLLTDILQATRVSIKSKVFSPRGIYYLKSRILRMQHRKELYPDGLRLLDNTLVETKHSSVEIIHLFDYVEWNRKKIMDTIQKELNWGISSAGAKTWHIDCKLVDVVNYCYKKAFGFSKHMIGHAAMFRDGQITRKELEQLFEDDKIIEFTPSMEEFLRNEIKLPKKTIDIMRAY